LDRFGLQRARTLTAAAPGIPADRAIVLATGPATCPDNARRPMVYAADVPSNEAAR
jgi:hypothetical protein